MVTRILYSLPLLLLFLPILMGGFPLYFLEAIILILSLKEFYSAFKFKNINAVRFIGVTFVIYLLLKNQFMLNFDITFFVLLSLFLICTTLVLSDKINFIDLSITFIGIIYICIFLDFISVIANTFDKGNIYVWIVFVIAISTDTFAYFIGYCFGKHKLIPNVSPNKTIEGSIGGIIACIATCCIYALIFNFKIYNFIIIGFLGSIVSQIGDLLASSIKRFVGIKDFGNIIPGHGGVLDRIDSIILIAPFVYYMLLFTI